MKTERFGEEKVMKCGMKAKIIAYHTYNNIAIMFENGIIKENISYLTFCHGYIHP